MKQFKSTNATLSPAFVRRFARRFAHPRGKITIASLSLTMDLLPAKISPVIDASLCGQRHFEFPFALQREPVDMKKNMGVKAPISLGENGHEADVLVAHF